MPKKEQSDKVEIKGLVRKSDKVFVPFCEWAEKYFYLEDTVVQVGKEFDFSNAELIKLDEVQRRICEHVLTPRDDGSFPYEEVVYSTIKKEGKTTLAGAVTAWFTACIDPPNLVLNLANDQDQSAGRIFQAALPSLYALGGKVPTAITAPPIIIMPNGTKLKAIANNYAGAAGANYGLTAWSELWAYTSERSRRLFDELVPVITKLKSIRWIETYVGFEDESDLMLEIFKRIFTDTTEKELQPDVEVVPELADITSDGKPCCYHHKPSGTFYYHNHTPKAYWNVGPRSDEYRARKKATLRAPQYRRLFENYWQAAEGTYIEPEWHDENVSIDEPLIEEPMFLAGDASQRNDTVSLVGVRKYKRVLWGKEHTRFKLVYCKIWDPKFFGAKKDFRLGTKKGDMDLEETIAKEVIRLYKKGLVIGAFWYDPYQLHQVAVNLRKKMIPCVEFGQMTERTKADSFLAEVLRKGEMDLFHHPLLEQHLKNAKGKEDENQKVRIVKGKIGNTNKVDGAVALAMATWVASTWKELNFKRKTTSSRSME